MSIEEEKQVSYLGNGTAGRENMTPPAILFSDAKGREAKFSWPPCDLG